MTGHGLHLTESGSGPAVLWLHGYTMDSTLWRPLWELLPGWRHIGVDLPGHGGSGPCPPGLTLPRLADRLAQVAETTGARRVAGLSFGSTSALQLAMQHPELVHRLVVAAPTLAGTANEPAAEQRYKQLMMLYRMTGPGEQLTDLWMASPPDIFRGTESHPELRASVRRTVLRHRWAELADGSMDTLTAHRHTRADLRTITAATLAVVGTEDMPAFTANAELLRGEVPGCRVLTVPDTGHLPLLERPEAVAEALAAHLR
ncbi:putative 2-succinyl-6-hydroxy-2,4-cyclohexadiene-1-carboxylate synthase [Streptomyces filipinensis]|uniref:2-succinyl-6-hydroxy-2,4-cyclohexadiene-1-carboxylate synthase n=1 Tax=Streptomyces filipinensis TaxID=66887 RepID=A0A918MBA8_9ACTN|nr:alpha/beta hydrolase [Streptomyces filipinensis]GGU90659.1 putative 2-succinyl-6-hydroxy-2,4-cyclohexadiene-1-carboxylate synthase [Streptomyces filipinensis]